MTSRNRVHLHATVLVGVSLALGLTVRQVYVSLWWLSLTGWGPMEIVLRRFGVQPGR